MQIKRSNKAHKAAIIQLCIYTSMLIILILTSANINKYYQGKNVLGIETVIALEEKSDSKAFWENFLKDHPNYIPGWIELGRWDRVREIDPNYDLHKSY